MGATRWNRRFYGENIRLCSVYVVFLAAFFTCEHLSLGYENEAESYIRFDIDRSYEHCMTCSPNI